jgi:hypothetical protein
MDNPAQCIDLSSYYNDAIIEDNITTTIEEIDTPQTIETATATAILPKIKPIILPRIIPRIIFIVPYRDREQQYRFFSIHMKTILEDFPEGSYKIYYVHQKDTRSFNRGAMKNIGFLYAKSVYPEDYKNITFVFNDIDTMPYTKNFLDYHTTKGIIKHFYGFTFTLGGIVSINGADFEQMNGYPNYWAWGFEDNALQKRAVKSGIMIDRSQFYPIMDKNILQLKDGLERVVNRGEFDRYMNEISYSTKNEGLNNISNINYVFDASSGFIDVNTFFTGIDENPALSKVHDIRSGPKPFQVTKYIRRGAMGMKFI